MNDLEFRVWDTYRWAADDFGVMPKSAAKLRGENDALRDQHTEEDIAAALQKLIDLALVSEFDHQGALYVCSLTWQAHQKITHPRHTHLPSPSPEVIGEMDVETRKLFKNFHEFFSKSAPSRARVTRETANGKRLTANGSVGEGTGKGAGLQRMSPSRGLQRSGDLRERFESFWAVYPRKDSKQQALKEWLRIQPDAALTDVMIAKVREQRASAQWLKDEGQFIPHGRTWLHQERWLDESVERSVPAVRGGGKAWDCPHTDTCGHRAMCEIKNAQPAKYPRRTAVPA